MHSLVNVAECGLSKTFLLLIKGLFLSIGSFSKTSKPAPNIILFFKALSKSVSFIIPPLDVLMITPLKLLTESFLTRS